MNEKPYNGTPPREVTPDGFKVYCAYDEIVEIDSLKPNPRNPNRHPEAQVKMLARIIGEQGWRAPITVSRRSGYIVRGHARRLASYEAGSRYAPIEWQDYDNDSAEMADLVADNRIAELAVLDQDAIAGILAELKENTDDLDPELSGFSAEQIEDMIAENKTDREAEEQAARLTLGERFLIPPFTVLDSRGGVWAERKKAWKRLGIRSEVGRGADDDNTKAGLTYNISSQPPGDYKAKNAYEEKIGQKISWEEFAELFPDAMAYSATSIFDPVLCELAYRWFCPQGGTIIDPFAGGSVRGVVAALTGRKYTGCDLSGRQIEANVNNWEEISHISVLDDAPEVTPPTWINGDSSHIDELAPGEYDLFFTCPPYADLEVYSDKPEDLSNKEYPEFLQLYRNVIRRATAMLKPDSFAVIVVSDLRDKKGFYRNFVSDTIDAFQDVGLKFYNEAILVNTAGGLEIRVGKQFEHSRKMGKDHQNVLVFCNGDPAQSAAFRTEDPQEYAEDINSYLKAEAGKLGVNHEKVLVFAKGDPEKAAETIGTPETVEEADRYDNTALLKEILGEDTGDE